MTEQTQASPDLTVALLGTGTMGAGMARNIARAGIGLRVWNRTAARAEPLAAAGIEVARTVAEAVENADVVLTMLWDADSVADALHAGAGQYAPGAVLVQASTVGVDGAARLGHMAAELGLVHLDAPVLGTKQPAEQGTLVVLASGPGEAIDRVAPVLDAISSRVIRLGNAGQGSRLKLSANAFVVTLLAGIAQSLAIARELGVDPALFLAAVDGGAMNAPYVQLKGRSMLAGDFTPAFGLDGALKDAGLIATAAAAAGVDTTLIDAVAAQQQRVVDAGHGELDMSAVYLGYDQPAGAGAGAR